MYILYTHVHCYLFEKKNDVFLFVFFFLEQNIIAVKQDCKITQLERGT